MHLPVSNELEMYSISATLAIPHYAIVRLKMSLCVREKERVSGRVCACVHVPVHIGNKYVSNMDPNPKV